MTNSSFSPVSWSASSYQQWCVSRDASSPRTIIPQPAFAGSDSGAVWRGLPVFAALHLHWLLPARPGRTGGWKPFWGCVIRLLSISECLLSAKSSRLPSSGITTSVDIQYVYMESVEPDQTGFLLLFLIGLIGHYISHWTHFMKWHMLAHLL